MDPVDDLIGQPLKNFVAPDALAEMQCYIERAFAGATVSYERRERPASGELRWARITLFPDREPGGRTGGAFVVINDIEDDIRIREALKSQEAQLRLFADNIPGPIAYLDKKLKYTFVNQAFANWVCRPQDEIYGKTPYEVMPHDVNSFLRPIIQARAGRRERRLRTHRRQRGRRSGDGCTAASRRTSMPPALCAACIAPNTTSTISSSPSRRSQTREEQLRLFTDNIPEPVVYVDTDRNYTFVNDAFLRLVGFDREGGDRQVGEGGARRGGVRVPAAVHRSRGARRGRDLRARDEDVNGRMRWLRNKIVPDMHFDATIKGYYIVGHDITDLKEAQEALAARESQLRAIMDGVPAPVAYIDRDEHCQYVNRTFLQYFGLTAEQVASMRLRDVVGHGIYASAQAMLSRALEGESTSFDRLVPGAGGARRWMTIRVVPDATPIGRRTRRVRADERHPRAQAGAGGVARQRGRTAPDHGQRSGARGVHRSRIALPLSQPAQRRVAVGEAQGTDRTPDRRSRRRRSARRQLEPLVTRVFAGETVSTEQLLLQPNGEQRWESIHYAPNRDAEGNVIGIYTVHTDIHDQKRNEEALRRANWMLSSHINNTPLAVLEWDRDFRLVRWSPQAENIFGWRAEEVLGMPITGSQLTHEADREQVVTLINKLMSGEEPRATGLNRNYRKDAETIWCEWYHSCLLDEQGTHRLDPVLRAGRELAHPGGRAPAIPRDARRADRAAQPAAAAGAPGPGDRAGQAQRPSRRRAVHRSGPLQERQRHAGPPHRRRAAEAA